jgi:hypothetical protein
MSPTPSTPEKAWMLATLKALADAGMVMVRELTEEVVQAEAPSGDAALKFSRLARAVRQSVSLYGLVLEDALVEKAKPLGPLSPPQPQAIYAPWKKTGQSEAEWTREQRAGSRACTAYEAIEKVIDDLDSGLEQDRLIIDLAERMETDADEALFDSDTPIVAVIADICKALNFKPDWQYLDEEDCDLDPADLARLRTGRFTPAPGLIFEAVIPPPPDPSAQSPPPGLG